MKDMRKKKRNVSSVQSGFSFVEMMVVVAIMTIVIAVLTDGMIQIQDKSANDVNKWALPGKRQFMDQILRDLRQCGFPSLAMFDPATAALNPNNIANGNGTNTTA